MLSSTRKPHLPHVKTDALLVSSPLRKPMSQKKDSNLPTINDIHAKFKSTTDINLFSDDPLGKSTKPNPSILSRASVKFAGSEILKSFNFALNPVDSLHP